MPALGSNEPGKEPRPARFLLEWELWAVLGLLVLVMSPWLLLGETLFFRDIHLLYAPTARIVHEQLHSGAFCLWEPCMHGGEPLLGNPNRSLLYPSRLIYAVLPPIAGLNWEIGLHLLLGALGAYLLCRVLGLARPAAAAAALVVALCGFSLSVTNNIGRLFAFHWMPLLLMWGHLLGTTLRRRWLLLLTLGLAVQWLSASIELILLTAILLGVWQMAFRARAGLLPRLVAVGTACGLGLLIAAAQVIPAAAVIARSQRGDASGVGHTLVWSVQPARYLEMVLPGVLGPLGTANPPDSFWGQDLVDEGYPYILSLYLGLVPLALAGAALLAGRGRRGPLPDRLCGALALTALLALVLACGRLIPGVTFLVEHVPGASSVRYPVKLVAAGMVPLAILAAVAIHLLLEGSSESVRRVRQVLAATTGLMLVAWVPAILDDRLLRAALEPLLAWVDPTVLAGVRGSLTHAMVAIALATLVACLPAPSRRSWGGYVLVLIIAVDLGVAAQKVLLHAPASLLEHEPPLAARIRSELGDGRLYRVGDPPNMEALLPEDSAAALCGWRINILSSYIAAGFGIPMIFHDDDPLLARRGIRELGHRLKSLDWPRRVPILRAAGVRVVLAPEAIASDQLEHLLRVMSVDRTSYHLYRLRQPQPPAWFVDRAIPARDQDEAMDLVTRADMDPAREVILEAAARDSSDQAVSTLRPERAAPTAQVRWLERTTDAWRLEVEVPEAGWLVMSEVYDPGWQVYVDGVKATLLRADAVLSAIELGPGRHLVHRVYRPLEVLVGAAVSIVGILLLAAAVWALPWLHPRVSAIDPDTPSSPPSTGTSTGVATGISTGTPAGNPTMQPAPGAGGEPSAQTVSSCSSSLTSRSSSSCRSPRRA